jgi:S1-C subfamily serine protease
LASLAGLVLLGLLVSGLVVLHARDYFARPRRTLPDPTPSRKVSTIDSVTNTVQLAEAVGLVVCGFTLTTLDGTKTDGYYSTGTCFAISADGALLTGRRVVEDNAKLASDEKLRKEIEDTFKSTIEPKIWVYFRDKKYTAKIPYVSEESDVALLRIRTEAPIAHFRLRTRDDAPPGTRVYAAGFPAGPRLPLRKKEAIVKFAREEKPGIGIDSRIPLADRGYVLTDGIISHVRREERATQLEHTARIDIGSAGGPLIMDDGEVVGLITVPTRLMENAAQNPAALGIGRLREELLKNIPGIAKLLAQ